MATISRWTPLHDSWRLHNDINRLFALAGRNQPSESEALANGWAPPVDIYEDTEGVTLTVEVPGLAAADIDIRVENNTLTLKGERKLDKEDKRENYTRVERFYGVFSRSFTLPNSVDTEKVRADFRNGVLSIFLPKREETRQRQIKVNVN
jgi:HSP20 family protein